MFIWYRVYEYTDGRAFARVLKNGFKYSNGGEVPFCSASDSCLMVPPGVGDWDCDE